MAAGPGSRGVGGSFARVRFVGQPRVCLRASEAQLELSPQDAARLKAIRAAVENELRLLDELLSRVSDPALKRALATARFDVANLEADVLRRVPDSPDPCTLLRGAELLMAWALDARLRARSN
jgi:hypothetical protein